MRLWWQDEIAKLRTTAGASAEVHALLLAGLWLVVVPLLIAFALVLAGIAAVPGISS